MFLIETLTPASESPSTPHPGLDLAGFPVVEMPEARQAGFAFAWCAAMRGVLAQNAPFILLDTYANAQETATDRQARRCWFATNAMRLQQTCKGYIIVEANIAQRADARSAALTLLGQSEQPALRIMVVSNATVAQQLAVVLLKTDVQPNARLRPAPTPRRRRI